MAQWIPDPQGRQEVEKVSKNLKLPVWQPWYKGKFRDFWNEVWGKIDDSYELLKTLADGKVSKTGDTMTGQLEIKINPETTADFLYMYRNDNKIASLGGGVDDFFIHNSTANTTLQLKNDGRAFYPANNLNTVSKEVVGAINELKTLADGKVSKIGDTMTGQLEIKINPENTSDFVYLYRNNDKIASLGGGVNDFFIHNSVANTTLQLKNNGDAFYPALNLETEAKEVVGAINELNSNKSNKTVIYTSDRYANGEKTLSENIKKFEMIEVTYGQSNGYYITKIISISELIFNDTTTSSGKCYMFMLNYEMYSRVYFRTSGVSFFEFVSGGIFIKKITGINRIKEA